MTIGGMWGFSLFPALRHKQRDSLRRAAADGDLGLVNSILRGKTPVDPKNKEHTSALQMACRVGNLDVVKALVANGADVNRVAPDGTPLMEAAAFGHTGVVAFLLESKANPRTDVAGDLPVHRAARFGRADVLRMLAALPGGPESLFSPNGEGKTPLMLACCLQEGGTEAVRFLMDCNVDTGVADKAGNTSLHMAAIAGNHTVARLLLDGPNGTALARATNMRGRTALHLAAAYGHKAVAQELVARRAGVSAVDQNGCTALHALCKSVMIDPEDATTLARLMLSAGANPAAEDADGCSCLDYATSNSLHQLLSDSMPSISGTSAGLASGSGSGSVAVGASGSGASDALAEPGAEASDEEHEIVAALAASEAGAGKPAQSKAVAVEIEAVAVAIEAMPAAGGNGGVRTPAAVPSRPAAAVKCDPAVAGASACTTDGGSGEGAEAEGTHAFLMKAALRRHTSEEPEGWKLGVAPEAQ